MFCREQVVQLHHEIDRIHRAGGEVVVVGNGAPHFIAGFRELTGYRGPLYTDPSLESYRAASLKRQSWRKWRFGTRGMWRLLARLKVTFWRIA